jgi:CHAT domain-containing protein
MGKAPLLEETALRQVTRELRGSLISVVGGDRELAARITAALDDALRKPPPLVRWALIPAIALDPRVHTWVLARLGRTPRHGVRLDLDRGGVRGEETQDEARPPEVASHESPLAAPRPRYLHAELVERVETGRPLSLFVSIMTEREGTAATLKGFEIPAAGATVTVTVSSAGLIPRGDMEADIEVPADGDSERHRFAFTAGPVGLQKVKVEAYRGGTHLGTVLLEVSVERNPAVAESRVRVAELSSVAFEPGEVTLQVRRGLNGDYRFQLLGDALYPDVTSVIGDTTTVVSSMVAELKDMAADRSRFTGPSDVRERLRNHGVQLWMAAVPKAVQDQFWEQAGRIKMFTIAADHDTIPWELLYPMDSGNDNGFLAEQFPVVRRAYAQRRVTVLPMDSAAYVVPPGSPANAEAEVDSIRELLETRVTNRGVVRALPAVRQLVLDSPGVLHFACHNTFSDVSGSSIKFDDGPWAPIDLSIAVARKALADARPLVFFNACRSAGEMSWLSQMSGWAGKFVEAGAGAFLGSLWAVRSSSARTFAQSFYEQFVDQGKPLGESSLVARKAIAAEGGDPTWLAYTVYGNPAAVAARYEEQLP